MEYRIIPVFIPHKGCPYHCVYCSQARQTGIAEAAPLLSQEEMDSLAEKHLATFPDKVSRIELAFFGGTFTGLDKEIQKGLLEKAAKVIKNHRKITGIRISTHPLFITKEKLELLKSYPVSTIELGIQSFDDEVLSLSGRGYNAKEAEAACRSVAESGFDCGIQLMTGLPGDTEKKSFVTAMKAAAIAPSLVRIYPAIVFRETPLETMYRQNRYKPQSLEEAVNAVKKLLLLFKTKKIPVIRAGIHPVRNTVDIIAGPYHPSFRSLCEQTLFLDLLLLLVTPRVKKIEIRCRPDEEAYVRGQGNENLKALRLKYPSCDITVTPDSSRTFILSDGAKKNIPLKNLFRKYSDNIFLEK
jgi:histone acetyltransferase (RNA polymerase elongator complex component)